MTDFKNVVEFDEKASRLRNFVFTCNNWTDESVKTIVDKLEPLSKYIIYGKEIGKKGTPHLQGYCQLKTSQRRAAIKKALPGFWFAKAKGNAEQASGYCKKDDDYYEWGVMKKAGKRTDIDSLYHMAAENKSDVEIGESNPSGYLRYYKAIDRVRLNYMRQNRKFEKIKVTVLWGEAGTGKSRVAYEMDPDLYHFVKDSDNNWFDGYTGQKTILFNDFYGGIRYGLFLDLTDGYKFNIGVKGGFSWKMWNHVIITSNKHPSQWYSVGWTIALQRRITTIVHFDTVAGNILPSNLRVNDVRVSDFEKSNGWEDFKKRILLETKDAETLQQEER